MAPPGAVLITGAGGHLGRQIARSISARSLRVAINDVDATSAERLAGSIAGSVPFAADVSDHKSAYGLVADVAERFGTIDVLINAAGSEGPIGAIEDLDPASVKHTFDVNVMSIFWMCAAVVPGMKQRRLGRIVNLASGAGLAGGELASPYHASKHAVVGLTRSLARELAPASDSSECVVSRIRRLADGRTNPAIDGGRLRARDPSYRVDPGRANG